MELNRPELDILVEKAPWGGWTISASAWDTENRKWIHYEIYASSFGTKRDALQEARRVGDEFVDMTGGVAHIEVEGNYHSRRGD
jgi:hypothetical protein